MMPQGRRKRPHPGPTTAPAPTGENRDLTSLAPTGKVVTITGTVTYCIVGGKAVEGWQNADQLSLLRQLGLIPAQGQAYQ